MFLSCLWCSYWMMLLQFYYFLLEWWWHCCGHGYGAAVADCWDFVLIDYCHFHEHHSNPLLLLSITVGLQCWVGCYSILLEFRVWFCQYTTNVGGVLHLLLGGEKFLMVKWIGAGRIGEGMRLQFMLPKMVSFYHFLGREYNLIRWWWLIDTKYKFNWLVGVKYWDESKIGTRLLFAGNLIKQPYFEGVNYRVVGELVNPDITMNQTLWLGLYPGLCREQLDYSVSKLEDFFGVSDF